jgi:hypothetical protein
LKAHPEKQDKADHQQHEHIRQGQKPDLISRIGLGRFPLKAL